MNNEPIIQTSVSHTSLEEEVHRLQAMLVIEQKARAVAESQLAGFRFKAKAALPPPSQMAMIVGLAKLAESRDDDTGTHLARIRHYSSLIANTVASHSPSLLSEMEASIIGATSVLHDIGKVGIQDNILQYPGKLTDAQFEIMKTHTHIGADILIALSDEIGRDPWIDIALQITLSHHERWDGGGYPFGLKGNTINLPARIVAVADVYDALTSKRVYKDEIPHEEAVQYIQTCAGSHFDPCVVRAFMSQEHRIGQIAKRLQIADSVGNIALM